MIIIIGASKNNKIGSKILRWWMGTEYSHVYSRWYLSTQERDIVYQASHGMVHYEAFNNFSANNEIIVEFKLELSEEQFKKFSQKCIDLSGIAYSIVELIQIFFCDVCKNNTLFVDQPGYICSELMAELLEDFFQAKFNKPKYLVTPKDIIEFLTINSKI